MTVSAEVIARIQKLLNTTGRTPEEAAQFVKKAQDLMLANDLEMEDVANLKADARSSILESGHSDLATRGKPEGWKVDLFRAVAETSDCYVITRSRSELTKSGRYRSIDTGALIGRAADVELAGYLFAFLRGEIERLANEYTKAQWQAIWDYAAERGISHQEAERGWARILEAHPLRSKVSWLAGATEGVIETLRRDKAERTKAAASHTALVVHKAADIEDYLYRKRGIDPDEARAKMAQRRAEAAERAAVAEAKEKADRAALLASETPFQRERRERREAKEREKEEQADDRFWRRYSNREARREATTDRTARTTGYRTGKDIALRPGVKPGAESERIGR